MKQEIWLGKYEIVKLLGEGAASRVYLANHIALGQRRAIKCIDRSHISYEQAKQEAQMLLTLSSPWIPEVYDIEEDESRLYIIEEYMEGESLISYWNREQPLPEAEVAGLAVQVCELIKYLHTREDPILYLDLKPSNLRIHNGRIKLIDFGSAMRLSAAKRHPVTGTRGYAAPEQYYGAELCEATDVYGIGMLLYYLMTGRVTEDGDGLPGCNEIKGYSKALLRLTARAVRHNPFKRFLSVESLECALRRLNKREQKLSEKTKSSVTIALAGSEHKIGVTHMAWYLLRELGRQKKKVLYVECSESNRVGILAKECSVGNKAAILYRGCQLTKEEWLIQGEDQEYDYIILDYGRVTNENISKFLGAQVRIAVFGGCLWERVWTERAVRMFDEYASEMAVDWRKEIRCVYNHLTAREFYYMPMIQGVKRFYRMPVECDALGGNNPSVSDVVAQIME